MEGMPTMEEQRHDCLVFISHHHQIATLFLLREELVKLVVLRPIFIVEHSVIP